MLHLPNGGSSIARVVGIDPGSETLGLAVLSFDTVTQEILQTDCHTVVGSRLNGSPWVGELHGDRFTRIVGHSDNLLQFFHKVQPLAIAAEAPFFNPLRPYAYGVLMEVMAGIRNTVMQYDSWMPLYLLEPSTVKKAIGAMRKPNKAIKETTKDVVREAMARLPFLKLSPALEYLDEHSLDAAAVAYTQYRRLYGDFE